MKAEMGLNRKGRSDEGTIQLRSFVPSSVRGTVLRPILGWLGFRTSGSGGVDGPQHEETK